MALLFGVVLSAVAILGGLYMILIQDRINRSRVLGDIAMAYVVQSQQKNLPAPVVDNMLDHAERSFIEAIILSPHEAGLWVRLAQTMAIREGGEAERVQAAFGIAMKIRPDLRPEIARRRAVLTQKESAAQAESGALEDGKAAP